MIIYFVVLSIGLFSLYKDLPYQYTMHDGMHVFFVSPMSNINGVRTMTYHHFPFEVMYLASPAHGPLSQRWATRR